MSVCVIDRLEVVEVDVEQSNVCVLVTARPRLQSVGKSGGEQQPIRQAGQWIMRSQMEQFLFGPLSTADIDVRRHRAAGVIPDRRDPRDEPAGDSRRVAGVLPFVFHRMTAEHRTQARQGFRRIRTAGGGGSGAHIQVVDSDSGALRVACVVLGEHPPRPIDRDDCSCRVQDRGRIRQRIEHGDRKVARRRPVTPPLSARRQGVRHGRWAAVGPSLGVAEGRVRVPGARGSARARGPADP